MSKILSLITIIFLCANSIVYANGLNDSSKEENIRTLVKLIDPSEQEVKWLKELFVKLTKVDQSEKEQLSAKIDFNTIVHLYFPIYDKYFTDEEKRTGLVTLKGHPKFI